MPGLMWLGPVHEMRAIVPFFRCCAGAIQFIGRRFAEDIRPRIHAVAQKNSVVVKKPQLVSFETKKNMWKPLFSKRKVVQLHPRS